MTRPVVGNDVVDLREPRVAGKLRDERFLRRVLDPAEHRAVLAASDPGLALWRHWAAKEAAYKVASKLRGTPPVFAHRAFVFEDGRVSWEGETFPVELRVTSDTVHAVATPAGALAEAVGEVHRLDEADAPWNDSLDALLARMTDREVDAIHSLASAAVRIGARAALANALHVDESRLQIVCAPGVTGRRPPMVLLDGAVAPADVSLSHHGAWIGWAVLSGSGAGS